MLSAVRQLTRPGRLAGAMGLAVALAAAVFAGSSIAAAGAASSPPTYSACLNHVSKTLYRVTVSPALPQTCKAGDTQVSWNQVGPQGTPGPQGPAGPGAATFTSSGIYTVPSGVTKVLVDLRGGGGGGAGMVAASGVPGGGGGQGAQAEALVPVSAGSQLTVTVGAAGQGGIVDPNSCTDGSGGTQSSVAAGGSALASAGGGGGGTCLFGSVGGPAGTAAVSSPAFGLNELPVAAGTNSGAGGGPAGIAGSGGHGAGQGDVFGQNGIPGAVVIIPAS